MGGRDDSLGWITRLVKALVYLGKEYFQDWKNKFLTWVLPRNTGWLLLGNKGKFLLLDLNSFYLWEAPSAIPST